MKENKKIKYNKKVIYSTILEEDVINNLKINEGKVDIKIYNPNNNKQIIYSYQNQPKNYYYYHCKKRRNCKGRGKLNKNNFTFEITNLCTNDEKHNKINSEEFESLYNKKN